MKKVWFVYEEEEGIVAFRKIPLFFLGRREKVEPVEEDGIYGGGVNVSQLRWWARLWLWLERISLIKVW